MFQEDLALFFKDFGVDVTLQYTDPDRPDVPIIAIFEDPYAAAQLGSYRVVATNPVLLAEYTDAVKGLLPNDVAVISGDRYKVEGAPHHDGTGVCRILLIDETLNDGVTTFPANY